MHKSITSSEEPKFVTDCEVEWLKVKMKNQTDLHVGVFYTPNRNPKDFKELNKSLNKLTDNGKKQREVILAGDFNCSNVDWATHSVGSTGKYQEAQKSLVDVTSDHLLTQIQQTPTRGPNVLDLVFTSNPTLVKTSVSVPGISDHDVVVSDFDAKPQTHHQKARKCNIFEKANLEKLKDDMNNTADITEEEIRQERTLTNSGLPSKTYSLSYADHHAHYHG